jgi:hypothetical protein
MFPTKLSVLRSRRLPVPSFGKSFAQSNIKMSTCAQALRCSKPKVPPTCSGTQGVSLHRGGEIIDDTANSPGINGSVYRQAW